MKNSFHTIALILISLLFISCGKLSRAKEKTTGKLFEHLNLTSVNRELGFYLMADLDLSATSDTILEKVPSLSGKDILKVKKINNANRSGINIKFTKEGGEKFAVLTKENIGKKIAIVIADKIVAMPIIYHEILGGETYITGVFTEEELDMMIELLQEKQ